MEIYSFTAIYVAVGFHVVIFYTLAGHLISTRILNLTLKRFNFYYPPRIYSTKLKDIDFYVGNIPLGCSANIDGIADPYDSEELASSFEKTKRNPNITRWFLIDYLWWHLLLVMLVFCIDLNSSFLSNLKLFGQILHNIYLFGSFQISSIGFQDNWMNYAAEGKLLLIVIILCLSHVFTNFYSLTEGSAASLLLRQFVPLRIYIFFQKIPAAITMVIAIFLALTLLRGLTSLNSSSEIFLILRDFLLTVLVFYALIISVLFLLSKTKKEPGSSLGKKRQLGSLEKRLAANGLTHEEIKQYLHNALDEANLDSGKLAEFQKGQKDFSRWGNGIVIGSKEWVINHLAEKLIEIGPNSIYIERTKNWDWQKSDLEGFTLHINASLTGKMAGYYLGRLGKNGFGIFGFGFNKSKYEPEYIEQLEEKLSSKTSLMDCAKIGNLAGAKKALEQGASINEKDERGITPLLWASVNGHAEVAKYLLENGADLNHKNGEGFNALMFATSNNHIRAAKILIEYGIDINYEKSVMGSLSNKITALSVARDKGHTEMIDFLLSQGAR